LVSCLHTLDSGRQHAPAAILAFEAGIITNDIFKNRAIDWKYGL